MKPKPRVNNVDDTSFEAASIGTSATVGEHVNQIDAMILKHSILVDMMIIMTPTMTTSTTTL